MAKEILDFTGITEMFSDHIGILVSGEFGQ